AMADPVPVDQARALGADFVIAAQPIPPLQRAAVDPLGGILGRARWLADLLPLRRLRNGIESLDPSVRSFHAPASLLATVSAHRPEAVVRPDLQRFWFLQFGDAGAIIEAGERSADAALPHIQALLAERIGFGAAPTSGGAG